MTAMTALCVIAHADDEIFCGASLTRFASEGHQVYVGALADGETSRARTVIGAALAREEKQRAAAQVLGCQVLGGPQLPDQRLDSVDLLDLTRIVEGWIAQVKPSVVLTHSPGDLNADHRRVYEAVLPAVRPKSGVKEVYSFAGPRMMQFHPTSFVVVTRAHIDAQREAMARYGDELIGEWDLVSARAICAGHQIGVPYAEGFETIRRRE